MSRAWLLKVSLAATLVVAACADPPTTPQLSEHQDDPPGLAFLFPSFDAALLVERITTEDSGEPTLPSGPARTVADEEEPPLAEISSEEIDDLVAAIYDARTFVGFNSNHVFAQGEHQYQGNKSSIETTLNVAFEGETIGSQLAIREDDTNFLLDLGRLKYISAFARIYTDQKCGLSASGSSIHRAWWEAVVGGAPSAFGQVGRTSYATPRRQPECEDTATSSQAGWETSSSSLGATCWVSIWYDVYTGEIYDIDVIYCEEIGG